MSWIVSLELALSGHRLSIGETAKWQLLAEASVEKKTSDKKWKSPTISCFYRNEEDICSKIFLNLAADTSYRVILTLAGPTKTGLTNLSFPIIVHNKTMLEHDGSPSGVWVSRSRDCSLAIVCDHVIECLLPEED